MENIFKSILIGLQVLLITLTGFSGSTAQAKKVQLALNWKAEPEFGGFYAAQAGGAFRKRGLDVEILQGGAGTPVVQMIASGKVDYGIVSADEVVMARSRGVDVVAVFAAYQTNPQAIMAHSKRGFKNLGELMGAEGELAMQKGLPYANFILNKYKGFKVRIVPYAGGIANFLNDPLYSQQCFVMSEPLEAEKKQAATKVFLVADEGYNPYTTVLAVRGELLKKERATVKAVVEAVRDGWGDYVANPEPVNKLMADLNKAMDPETFTRTARAQLPLLESADTKANGLGHMSEERWKILIRQLSELKVIRSSPESRDMFVNL